MPTPSLLIVPARFKSGKLYSQIPTSGAGDFTVTRATAATRVNASGFIESVASGIPRLDYFASGGVVGCPALLVEPSAQNLAWHSETWASGNNWDLTNGVTTATGSTSAFTAPNGTTTANAISPTSGNVFHFAGSNSTTQITYTSGTIYTQSAFFKAGTGTAGQFVQLTSWFNVATQNAYANYDLQNGLVTVVSGSAADANRSARIDNYGNGWYRCIFTFTANANGTERGVRPVLITASGSTRIPAFSGTVTDVLYGWGAQVETGSVATSYIPTTTGSVTRNAEVISVSGAVSGSIGQTEGTIYAEVDIRNMAKETHIIRIDEATAVNTITLRTLTTNVIRSSITAATTSGTINISSAVFTSGIVKVAFAYKSGDIAITINGTTVVTANGTFTFDASLNRVFLGGNNTTSFFNDRIRAVALYTTRLTNAQLAALTTP